MTHLGLKYLTAIVEDGDVQTFVKLRLPRKMFKALEVELYDFIDQHVRKYGAVPAASTVEKHLGADVFEPVDEPPAFYADEVESRYIADHLKQHVKDVRSFLTQDNMDPHQAMAVARESISDLQVTTNHQSILDFRQSRDVVIKEYKQKLTEGDDHGFYTGWPTLDKMTQGLGGGDVMSIVGRPAMGKAITLDTPIIMADGSVKAMGKIKVNDAVASVDGAASVVQGVYPQGQRQTYRFNFDDGRFISADGEHLWEVGCKHWPQNRVLTTDEVRDLRKRARYTNTLYLELSTGDFGAVQAEYSAYILGVMLGDGCLAGKGPTFTSEDSPVSARVARELPKGCYLTPMKCKERAQTYYIASLSGTNPITAWLRSLGVWGETSKQKHIPDEVFSWVRSDRAALLQGLFDADGWVEKTGSIQYATSSTRLAVGVCRLMRSLGGKATVRSGDNDGLRVTLIPRCAEDVAYLPRKRDRIRVRRKNPNRLFIRSIENSGFQDCQCIAVSHPRKLFLAGSYIPTHNTWKLLYSGHNAWKNHGKRVMLVSMEMASTILAQRVIAMHSHVALTQLKSAMLSKPLFDKMKAGFKEIEGFDQPFWIIDGNLTATTVDDITMLAHQLKPDVILIDGAYLLRHPKIQRKHDRVDTNAELIKYQLSAELDVPVVASYQFNREAAKLSKTKQEDVGLEHIGLTDSIGQLSSVVTGLFEDDNIETIRRRRIQILKGRSGETGEFFINWNFQMMDFDEYDPAQAAESLQHL